MKRHQTVHVVVVRRADGFHAHAGPVERIHPNSSTLAARAAAADWLGVGEAALEMTPLSPSLIEAAAKAPATTIRWDLLALVVGAALAVVGAWYLSIAQIGGGL